MYHWAYLHSTRIYIKQANCKPQVKYIEEFTALNNKGSVSVSTVLLLTLRSHLLVSFTFDLCLAAVTQTNTIPVSIKCSEIQQRISLAEEKKTVIQVIITSNLNHISHFKIGKTKACHEAEDSTALIEEKKKKDCKSLTIFSYHSNSRIIFAWVDQESEKSTEKTAKTKKPTLQSFWIILMSA